MLPATDGDRAIGAVEIALDIGIRSNVVAMLRTGKMRLPRKHAISLARCIGMNPLYLARRSMPAKDWQAIVRLIPQVAITAHRHEPPRAFRSLETRANTPPA